MKTQVPEVTAPLKWLQPGLQGEFMIHATLSRWHSYLKISRTACQKKVLFGTDFSTVSRREQPKSPRASFNHWLSHTGFQDVLYRLITGATTWAAVQLERFLTYHPRITAPPPKDSNLWAHRSFKVEANMHTSFCLHLKAVLPGWNLFSLLVNTCLYILKPRVCTN